MGWLTAMPAAGRALRTWPLGRLTLIGAPMGIAILLLFSPYPELRFAHPAVVLMALSVAMIERRWRGVATALAALMAAAALISGFPPDHLLRLLPVTLGAMIMLGSAAGVLVITRWSRQVQATLAAAGALMLAGAIYVNWPALRAASVAIEGPTWQQNYGPLAEGWHYIRENAVPGSVIALANSSSVYPLQGRSGELRVIHVSARPNVEHIGQLPPIPGTLTWHEVNLAVWHATYADAHQPTWQENLRQSRADYLVVARTDPTGTNRAPSPPELQWAREAPDLELVFDNEAVAIWRRDGR